MVGTKIYALLTVWPMKECRKQVQKVSQSIHHDLTLSWKSKKQSVIIVVYLNFLAFTV